MKLFALMSCGEVVTSFEPTHGVEFVPTFKNLEDAEVARNAYIDFGAKEGYDDSGTDIVEIVFSVDYPASRLN